MNEALTTVSMFSFIALAVAGMGARKSIYRASLICFAGSLFARAFIEYGVLPGAVALAALAIVLPVLLEAILRFGFWLTWRGVRTVYPSEPKRVPTEKPSLVRVYQRVWSL